MIVKTRELSGRHLDYAVAKSLGYEIAYFDRKTSPIYINVDKNHFFVAFNPSKNGEQCDEFIKRYQIKFRKTKAGSFCAASGLFDKGIGKGATHLEAACRLIVSIIQGNEIDIPDGLVRKI
ncbi:DUF2591 family protein [Arsenophonus nasoniae]|uniref:DUF2591 family protein n=1 Tax=Arsenophonus nasoniae TaxID=638 RepID=D2U460_9GAMM|nr:phage protein NinX family protein [Arsenophonus nasoniae]QBY45034.1 hypothetical protein ArsFIN_36260 [Arsenophonus nasoniae]WGM05254.1 DUF2591 family protein [Arsenophonus nasoniae]WGM10265.1 DUF2591 family protein [Arsenophonus nasoniae]WGM14980.1 DUF2591 family protein [Arsenophonus nasoniae]CBA76307.1 hypothetical protein ARN_34710 [Arsenophonus nasoniae]